jgi:hypothetical protein
MNHTSSENVTYSAIVLLEELNPDFSQHVMALYRTLAQRRDSFEIVIVANGLESFLRKEMGQLNVACRHVLKAIALNKKTPQAVSLKAGFKESRGEIIIVTGSYQQLSEESLGFLLDALNPETDIISPWRRNRVDPAINQFQSSLFNLLVRKLTGSNLKDLSCTVKVMRRAVLEETPLYGNLYRFMPIVASNKGFRYKEIGCDHFQERGKVGFYGLTVYFNRLVDILTLYFNTRFTRKPLRFFSSIGAFFFTVGLAGFSAVFLQKILMGIPVGGRADLLLSILFGVIGIQCATVGLLGEIVAFTYGRNRKEYTIETILE